MKKNNKELNCMFVNLISLNKTLDIESINLANNANIS